MKIFAIKRVSTSVIIFIQECNQSFYKNFLFLLFHSSLKLVHRVNVWNEIILIRNISFHDVLYIDNFFKIFSISSNIRDFFNFLKFKTVTCIIFQFLKFKIFLFIVERFWFLNKAFLKLKILLTFQNFK